MIAKLTETDRQAAMAFLAQEPEYNVFAIGDIENFGFESDFQEVWADRSDEGIIRAVILRYYTVFLVYSNNDDHAKSDITSFLSSQNGKWSLSGKEAIVDSLAENLEFAHIQRQDLAKLSSFSRLPRPDPKLPIEWADSSTFKEVRELHSEIEEFRQFDGTAEGIEFNQKSGTGRTALIRVDGRVVASASSAAENSESAMIIGVCTAKSFRGKGYATACMAGLCSELARQGKTVCLFYQNPNAARIYKKIGFENIGRWAFAHAKD